MTNLLSVDALHQEADQHRAEIESAQTSARANLSAKLTVREICAEFAQQWDTDS